MGLTFLQEPWQMSYDRHDHCLRLAILRQPSILAIATSQAHNFLVMDPFWTKELPTERYQSPLSVGGVLVSNRHVFKNLRGFYENGSDIFARALVDVLRSLPTSWNTTMAFRSIPIISTSQAHNFFDMDPFLVRVLPIERYESPLSVGGALVSNRHVFKNFFTGIL